LAERGRKPRPPLFHDTVDKVRLLMEARQLSQSAIDRKTNGVVSQSRLSRWLDYRGEPNLDQLAALADALQVPFDYLANPKRTETPSIQELETETQVREMVRRLGTEVAIDRLLLIDKRSQFAAIGWPQGNFELMIYRSPFSFRNRSAHSAQGGVRGGTGSAL
jgi:transcriptional regulator with XRE-family HTH domain